MCGVTLLSQTIRRDDGDEYRLWKRYFCPVNATVIATVERGFTFLDPASYPQNILESSSADHFCSAGLKVGGIQLLVLLTVVAVFVSAMSGLFALFHGSPWLYAALSILGLSSAFLIIGIKCELANPAFFSPLPPPLFPLHHEVTHFTTNRNRTTVRVVQWRIFELRLLPGYICYDSTLWDILFTLAMLILLLSMFPYDKTRKMLHYYYRWKLRRAFYYRHKDVVLCDTIKKKAGRTVPYFISSVVMNDFVLAKDHPTNRREAGKQLEEEDDGHKGKLGQLDREEIERKRKKRVQPFHLFSLAPRFCGSKRTGYMRTSQVPPRMPSPHATPLLPLPPSQSRTPLHSISHRTDKKQIISVAAGILNVPSDGRVCSSDCSKHGRVCKSCRAPSAILSILGPRGLASIPAKIPHASVRDVRSPAGPLRARNGQPPFGVNLLNRSSVLV